MSRAEATGAAIGGGLAVLAASVRTEAAGTELARLLILGLALGAVVATDLAEHRIPNRIVVPAAAACVGLLAAEAGHPQHLLGGLAVVALMLGLSLLRPAFFGMGDVKLALLLGAMLGRLSAVALIVGMVAAVVPALVLFARHGKAARKMGIPFGPFLALGGLVALFAGHEILHAYLALY